MHKRTRRMGRLVGFASCMEVDVIVYRKAIELVRDVQRLVLPRLETRDAELHQQLHRAVRSVVLNIAEGRSLRGKRRGNHFAIALGSARETHACIELALALELMPDGDSVARLLDGADHVQAMLYKLSR